MVKTTIEVHEVVVIDDILCNQCGQSCRVPEAAEKREFDCLDANVNWGYHSSKDLETHKWHLCETCYDALIATFAIPPSIEATGL